VGSGTNVIKLGSNQVLAGSKWSADPASQREAINVSRGGDVIAVVTAIGEIEDSSVCLRVQEVYKSGV
jgi:hypothetical protein